ncbi:MAG: RNA 2',3'-cyclic phosphodiesterase [Elusimicrobia bacterium]|nr:RNA 2',3'-cyclic phosphodiesterase [Candidatus Obscuribacterium magneticum]
MRLFIGLKIPSNVKAHLSEALRAVRKLPGVRWIPEESFHLTLKFLGECELPKVEEMKPVITEIAARHPVLHLGLHSGGAFPEGRSPRVLWTAVGGDTGVLLTLAQTLEEALVSLGFPKENRSFHPHLTVARVKEPSALMEPMKRSKPGAMTPLDQFCTLFASYTSPAFEVTTVDLIQSFLHAGGARYEDVESFPLRSH